MLSDGRPTAATIGHVRIDLGRRLARHRGQITGWTALSWLLLLCVPIGIGIGLGATGWLPWWLAVVAAMPALVAVVLYAIWVESSALDVHAHGVVVGRTFLGSSHRWIRYDEIHPASIRVFSGIDDIRTPPHRVVWPGWNIGLGSDMAVTFLGPSPHLAIGHRPRPPAPGPGVVIVAARHAHEAAAQLRAGLERAGCPPHLARWSEGLAVEAASVRRSRIPGYDVGWRP